MHQNVSDVFGFRKIGCRQFKESGILVAFIGFGYCDTAATGVLKSIHSTTRKEQQQLTLFALASSGS
jgi:hypothetical protein